ncbi:MAG: 3-oxoacyl-ACP reductase [Hamadaea sp.]|nr:3-oxoacyl-ACP reductase [Hamadaea sp.]
MSDRYASFARSAPGHLLIKRLGLPNPPKLRRYEPGKTAAGPVLVAGEGRFATGIAGWYPAPTGENGRLGGLVLDATTLSTIDDLRDLYDIVHPVARGFLPSGRVVVLGALPAEAPTAEAAAVRQGLEGFTRSLAKEMARGTTVQLVRAADATGPGDVRSTLDFFLSGRSAYVDGQVVTVSAPVSPVDGSLSGKVALVTGAARGIGADIARVLARGGAHVVCLDVPAAGDALAKVANGLRPAGSAYQADLSVDDAAARLVDHLKERHGRVDVIVHNAGITRDKTLANMRPDQWDQVLTVNLAAPVRVTEALLAADLIPAGGRVIGVSSVVGLAGNRGQTNYATSKAGVAGWVRALAPIVADRGITANAVAPGFIETAMTANLPMVVREGGRRMNSLAQGGLPIDVAETVGWLAEPGSAGVTGNVVRVCGQQMLGA